MFVRAEYLSEWSGIAVTGIEANKRPMLPALLTSSRCQIAGMALQTDITFWALKAAYVLPARMAQA